MAEEPRTSLTRGAPPRARIVHQEIVDAEYEIHDDNAERPSDPPLEEEEERRSGGWIMAVIAGVLFLITMFMVDRGTSAINMTLVIIFLGIAALLGLIFFLGRKYGWQIPSGVWWLIGLALASLLIWLNVRQWEKENALRAQFGADRLNAAIDSVKKANLGYHELAVGKVTNIVATTQGSARYLRPFGHVLLAEVVNAGGCSYVVEYEPQDEPGVVKTALRLKNAKHANIEAPRWVRFLAWDDCSTVNLAVKVN